MISVAVLAGLLSAVPLVAHAGPSDPVREQALADGQKARELARSPRAAAYLFRLQELRDRVGDLNLLAQPYSDLLGKGSTHPLVRRLARTLYANVERARGQLHKAEEIAEPLGYLEKFYVVGGFDNEGKGGCDTDYGPESKPDLSATYPAKEREASWQKVELPSADGFVDLGNLLRPQKETVAYAMTFLEAPADTRAELFLGSSGGTRLWVNGERVLKSDAYNQPRPDQAHLAVHLRKGTNRVLLKVCQDQGPFGFYLAAVRAGGPAAISVLPATLPALPKGAAAKPEVLPTLSSLLHQEVKAHPKDATVRGELASVLEATRTFDAKEHEDTVEAQKAADDAPADAGLQALAAQLQTDDANQQRRYLDRARKLDPQSPLIAAGLARWELDHEHPERAQALLLDVVKAFPEDGEARILEARARDALGEGPEAEREVEDALALLRDRPFVVKEAARISRRKERLSEAVDRLHVALALRYDDDQSRRALASILSDLGRIQDAAKELRTLLSQDPSDNGIRLRLADLLAANGDDASASTLFAEAEALCPNDPEVPERHGRALLQAGKRDEALAAFERSLSLHPQNPALREVVRSLRGTDTPYGQRYALEIAPLVKEADALTGEDSVYLADYTYTRVQQSGLSSRFHQLAVKVYSQRGVEQFRSFPISYSPNRQEVVVQKVRITKPDGSMVESFNDNDRAVSEPWSGMYYDAHARVLTFPALAVGDVLELQYRLEDTARDNLLSDYWGDVDYVQATSPKVRYLYLVDMPKARALYWNKARVGDSVKVSQEPLGDDRELYKFAASKIAKVVPEPSMPGWAEVASTLHVSTYKSWEDVGRYWWGLVRDQLVPNDELRHTVDQALAGVDRSDQLAVVRAIYDFVVTNTRYVALEFGIHGYKPYRVDQVLSRRFGDCKDKASLIHAMLKVAGVDSDLVLLRMRHLGELDAEPASLAAFNHAIVYVPKFDLYLDGTASFHGAKELPVADRAADVLRVDPSGKSVFAVTPEAVADDNVTALDLDVALSPDGSANMTGQTTVGGVQAPEYRETYQAAATRKAAFEQAWAQTFPGLTAKKVEINDVTALEKNVRLDFEMGVPRFAEVLPGGLRFFAFGSGRNYTQALAPLNERKHDLLMSMPWKGTFQLRYKLPAGYSVDSVPSDVDETTPFGHLKLTQKVDGGVLRCEGELTLTVTRVKTQDYPAFRAFLTRVDQAFARKVVIRRLGGTTAER